MAQNSQKAIETILQTIFEKMKFAIDKKSYSDKTFTAKVTEIVSVSKCRVLYCGNTYTVSTTIPVEKDDVVRVCAPCNNWQDLYIIENKTSDKTLADTIDSINNKITTINENFNRMNSTISILTKLFTQNAKVEFKDISVEYTNQSDYEYFKQTYKTHFPESNKVYIGTWWHSDQEIYLCRFYSGYSYGGMLVINCNGDVSTYFLSNNVWHRKNYQFTTV